MSRQSCFSTKIDLSIKEKLQQDLIDQGFVISQPPYTIFSAKKTGVHCTLYESGKLTVQGKEMGPFLEFYLEPEILKSFHFTHPTAHLDLTPRIGMDEAGKGDFFGPLCIAALYADEPGIRRLQELGVKDSKSFSDTSLLKLAQKIRVEFSYTVIRLFPKKYNELYGKFKNLNRLLAWAHVAALADISQKTDCKTAILDQFAHETLVNKMLSGKKLNIHLTQRTKGESDVVVAAASILARAAFLDGISQMSEEFETEIPKGASEKVKIVARSLAQKFGRDVLERAVKLHFKLTDQLFP